MNRLQQLHDAGVSIWLDTLSRELLDTAVHRRRPTLVRDRRSRASVERAGPLRS